MPVAGSPGRRLALRRTPLALRDGVVGPVLGRGLLAGQEAVDGEEQQEREGEEAEERPGDDEIDLVVHDARGRGRREPGARASVLPTGPAPEQMSRIYTEREIAALLARAAERQQAAPEDHAASGLSLNEIARVAAEAGLDPAHLRAAAAELDAGMLGRAAAPGAVVLERWIDAPLTDAAWEEAVAALRVRFGASVPNGFTAPVPETARVGAAHEWTHSSMGGITTTVTVSPRGERTRVRLTQSEWGAVGDRATAAIYAGLGSLLLALLAGVGGAVLGAGGLVAWMVALAVLVVGTWGGSALATPAVRRSRARRAAKTAEALDAVARCVESAASDAAPAATGERHTASAVFDLDALPDPLDDATTRHERRRTGS